MIRIQGLSKRFKNGLWSLKEIDLCIEGGMFGLLGPNGAGKTTLMRILAAITRPTSGEVWLDGVRLSRRPDAFRRRIGYLPQFFQIHPYLTGYQFLEYAAVMKEIHPGKERKRRISEWLDKVDLTEYAHQKVRTYSGGMKQRLAIAQALLGSPDVLIADEPTAGLDPEERIRFRELLARYSMDRTVILSTHMITDMESICTRLAVLDRGSLLMEGTLVDLRRVAQGKVWEATVDEETHRNLPASRLVSSRRTDQGVLCRLIGTEPPAACARPVEPEVEDGYLALIGGEFHA